MTSNLLFDFSVNKTNNSIEVTREFAANLDAVWEAWTKPEVLDLWWAPKPYQAKTKLMDFKEGGTWLYSMISPENVEHWCKSDYKEINALKMFSAVVTFCDENGENNHDFPHSFWTNSFSQNDDSTTVSIKIDYDSVEDLEKIIEMGFKEGFTMALGNLDPYFANQSALGNQS